jgi:hypothetical protein
MSLKTFAIRVRAAVAAAYSWPKDNSEDDALAATMQSHVSGHRDHRLSRKSSDPLQV